MIALTAPSVTFEDRRFVADAVLDHRALEGDRWVRQFEEEFAAAVGCSWAVAVCSGTAALELAFRAADVDSRFVRLPTFGCVASVNAVRSAYPDSEEWEWDQGRFSDTQWDTRKAQGIQEHATVLTHLFGRHTATTAVCPIEDFTLSLGALTGIGDLKIGVCSTHETKMISTGRGGVVFGNDEWTGEHVRRLAYYDLENPASMGSFSYGMAPLAAVLGVSQLRRLPSMVSRRREIAGRYTERFTQHGIVCPDAGTPGVFFRYLIDVADPAAAVSRLAELGVIAGRGVNPLLHRLFGLGDDGFPGACSANGRLLSVPCYPSLDDVSVARVYNAVARVAA